MNFFDFFHLLLEDVFHNYVFWKFSVLQKNFCSTGNLFLRQKKPLFELFCLIFLFQCFLFLWNLVNFFKKLSQISISIWMAEDAFHEMLHLSARINKSKLLNGRFDDFRAELKIKSNSIRVFIYFGDSLKIKDFQRKRRTLFDWIIESFKVEVKDLNEGKFTL